MRERLTAPVVVDDPDPVRLLRQSRVAGVATVVARDEGVVRHVELVTVPIGVNDRLHRRVAAEDLVEIPARHGGVWAMAVKRVEGERRLG